MKIQARHFFVLIVLFFLSLQSGWAQPGCIGFNADFDFEKDSTSYFPIRINFTNTSLWTDSTTQYRWTYGNGDTMYIKEGDYRYITSGTYNVCLLAANIKKNGDTTCRDTACKQVSISIDSCIRPVTTFKYARINPDSCFAYSFAANTTGPYNYLWDFGDNTTTAIKDPLHHFISKGIYTVCFKAYYLYKNNLECANNTCVDIDVCYNLSAEKIATYNNEAYLYPNPVSTFLNIKSTEYGGDINISITDLAGKQVHQSTANSQTQMDVSFLQAGIYFVTLSANNAVMSHQKLIKQ
jgi:hypothetical protein